MNSFIIKHANIVTPDRIIENGTVIIKEGLIAAVEEDSDRSAPASCRMIDAMGRWLIPGIIDLHNDSIEKELEPRPNALFPIEIALFSLESRLLNHGITSIYHSFSFTEHGSEIRNPAKVYHNINEINRLKQYGSIRHYIHARYDVTEKKYCSLLMDLIDSGRIHLLSFMDHTPGQGQYRSVEEFRTFVKKYRNLNDDEADMMIAERQKKSRESDPGVFINLLSEKARSEKIPIASHDDDSTSKILYMKSKGVGISEFPINLDTAVFASNEGLYVVVGAPNVIRGCSTSGNMCALDAIMSGAANILCSDYMSSSILHAIFRLYRNYGLDLSSAVNMASINPARAAGLDGLGSIETGKCADLLLVREAAGIPFVDMVFLNGFKVLEKGMPCGEIA